MYFPRGREYTTLMKPKGFYLYAVRPVDHNAAIPEVKGIDNDGHVFTAVIGDQIEVVVSLVSLEDFDAAAVQERAQNDLKWIKEKSLLHNQVVMESAKETDGAIVPMKFGSIFKTRQSLSKAIKKDSAKFLELFQKLKGREEWAVKVYANSDALEEKIKASSAVIRNKQSEISSLPTGIAYFKEKELQDTLEEMKNLEVQKFTHHITERLSRFSEEELTGKILGKELTMRDEPMVLNAVFLVRKKKFNKFGKELKKLQNAFKENGLIFELSGPWPPYNFT